MLTPDVIQNCKDKIQQKETTSEKLELFMLMVVWFLEALAECFNDKYLQSVTSILEEQVYEATLTGTGAERYVSLLQMLGDIKASFTKYCEQQTASAPSKAFEELGEIVDGFIDISKTLSPLIAM